MRQPNTARVYATLQVAVVGTSVPVHYGGSLSPAGTLCTSRCPSVSRPYRRGGIHTIEGKVGGKEGTQ